MTASHPIPHAIPYQNQGGVLCMKGGVYQDRSRPGTWIARFPGISKRFNDMGEAERFLNMVRYKFDEGTLDPRQFKADQPLGFRYLSSKWLDRRTQDVKCPRNLVAHIRCAQDYFGHKYVRDIRYADIEDYIDALPKHLKGKTKKNYLTTLHSFWSWLIKRNEVDITQVQSFPQIEYELGWRNTVDKNTQQNIIEEVKRISYHINPKIWIGIRWLSIYVSIRPVEMINIREEDFDYQMGTVNVKRNKTKGPKIVPMLPEDLETVKSFGPVMPHLHFFRHTKGISGVREGQQFGEKYFYKWWKKACANLGVEDVDLYGGTRHSSVKALRNTNRPDEIKQGTMHQTNAAFERYYQIELEDARKIYRQTSGNDLVTISEPKKSNILQFRKP